MALASASLSSKMALAPYCERGTSQLPARLAQSGGGEEGQAYLQNALDVLRFVLGVDTLDDEMICAREDRQQAGRQRGLRNRLTEAELLVSGIEDLLLARTLDEQLEDSDGFLGARRDELCASDGEASSFKLTF